MGRLQSTGLLSRSGVLLAAVLAVFGVAVCLTCDYAYALEGEAQAGAKAAAVGAGSSSALGSAHGAPSADMQGGSAVASGAETTVKQIAQSDVALGKSSYAYTSKAIEPKVSVVVDGAKLVKGTDYTVAFANNRKVGTGTVTVAGIGGFTGKVQKTFGISPKAGKLSKVKSKKYATVTVKAKSGLGGSRYQFAIGTSKSPSKALKKVTTKKSLYTFKKLKEGKKYYVHVRSAAVVGGKTVYGEWSAAKAVRVKTHPFVGTWKLATMEDASGSVSEDDVELLRQNGLEVVLTLTTGRKSTLDLFGDVMEGTWYATSEKTGAVTLDGEEVLLAYEGGELSISQNGAALHFRK